MAAVLLVALMAGCDSDSNDDEVSQEALTQMSTMMGKVQSALTTALTQIQFTATASKAATAPARPARAETIDCPQSGRLLIDGDVSDLESGISFDLSMEFDDCDGIDGSLDYRGESIFTETGFDYGITMNGSLHGQCTLSYNNYSQDLTIDGTSGGWTVVTDGSMGVQCGASSFTCSFDNETYTADGPSIDALRTSCR